MAASLVCVERDETPLRVYTTAVGYIPGVDFLSAANADARCMNDVAYPGAGNFKALIGSPLRTASPLETDWVLKPYRAYARASDGAIIQTTGASAIWNFPLQHSVGELSQGVWTGLRSNWTRYTALSDTCSDWTSSTGSGGLGDTSQTSPWAIDNGLAGCSFSFAFICVEQP